MLQYFSFTGIGSLPFRSIDEAVSYVFSSYEIPFVPQLPGFYLEEQMIYQFLEDFPGFSWKKDKKTGFIDLKKVDGKIVPHSFSFRFFKTLPLFLKTLEEKKTLKCIKCQIAAPFTIASQVLCSDGKSVWEHKELYPIFIDFYSKKTKALLSLFPKDIELIFFFDEPCLWEKTIQFALPDIELLISHLKKSFSGRQIEYGLHSCNRWTPSLFEKCFKSPLDMLSFDFEMLKSSCDSRTMDALISYVKRGWILWGLQKTDILSDISYLNKFLDFFKKKELKKENIIDIVSHSLLSPTCGTAGWSIKEELTCSTWLKKTATKIKNFYKKENKIWN